jgi:hypothetical protein
MGALGHPVLRWRAQRTRAGMILRIATTNPFSSATARLLHRVNCRIVIRNFRKGRA